MRFPLRPFLIALLASLLISLTGRAEQLFPGKYTGMVIFDRWDACILYSGMYFLYVSESQKEKLRPFAGQPVLIDATKIRQFSNPGDVCVTELEYLGPPPSSQYWELDKTLKVHSRVFAGETGKPVLAVTLENTGDAPIAIACRGVAPLLLKRGWPDSRYYWGQIVYPSVDGDWRISIIQGIFHKAWPRPARTMLWTNEGPSIVVLSGCDLQRIQKESHECRTCRFVGWPEWRIDQKFLLPDLMELSPREKKNIEVQLHLPDGEYNVLCGYGDNFDNVAISSNLVAFDVKDGWFVPVDVPGR